MSLFRIASTAKAHAPLFVGRAVLTHVTTTSVFRRSYWWRRKSDGDAKPEKGSESEKKTEKKNAEATPNNKSQTPAVDKLKELSESMNADSVVNDLGKYSDSLLRSDVRAEGLNDLPDVGPMPKFGQNAFKSFQDFIAPRPLRLHDEMIIPAIPLPVRPLLPGFLQNLTISDRATIQKLREVQSSPDRYVGLFLRKAKSSNDLVDKPDVIKSLEDIYPVGT